jgi:hypothetical protein
MTRPLAASPRANSRAMRCPTGDGEFALSYALLVEKLADELRRR